MKGKINLEIKGPLLASVDFKMLAIIPGRLLRDSGENGMKTFSSKQSANPIKEFHLRFNQNFDYFLVRRDWKREFL